MTLKEEDIFCDSYPNNQKFFCCTAFTLKLYLSCSKSAGRIFLMQISFLEINFYRHIVYLKEAFEIMI
jgi:hypothetical protein